MIDNLYISTVDYNWGRAKSTLLTHKNIDVVIKSVDKINCHTSIEDLVCDNINKACSNAREITLVNLDENVQTTNINNFAYGRLFHELVRNKHKVQNFEYKKIFNQLRQSRCTDGPVLWAAGCSVTDGHGLPSTQYRWSELLGKKLNMPYINLAKGGTSIFWSADQILRSDIRHNDIVVWGLTNCSRVEISDNWEFNSVTASVYDLLDQEHQYWNLDYFNRQTQFLKIICNILQVNNFCKKIGAKLYLANILDVSWTAVALQNFENFIDLTHTLQIVKDRVQFLDLALDNQHPGQRQHQEYAENIFNFIKESNHG